MNLTVRNILLSLVLSLALTFVVTMLYLFYPLLWIVISGTVRNIFSRNPHSDGIAAVASGVSEPLLLIVIVTASVLFVLIFVLLQRRARKKHK